jgi:transcriptional regulator with XRE-family HTH domain
MDLKDVISKNITKRREELNLTQSELSDLSGISKGQISEYERSISLPKADALYKLAIAMKTDINYFYNGINELNIESLNQELAIICDSLSMDLKKSLYDCVSYLIIKK